MRVCFPIPLLSTALTGWISIALTGCDEWPRHQHKPSIEGDALEAGAPPSNGLSIDWLAVDDETEPNLLPVDGIALDQGEGIRTSGTLEGLGWDSSAIADRVSDCDTTLAFPPAAPGEYTGDVDWITVVPDAESLLCVELRTDHPTARLDVALYALGSCNEPVGVFVHPGSTTPIGVDVPASRIRWAIGVEANAAVAVGIAGFFPDDADLNLDWTASLAFVPSVEGAADSLCPREL